MNRSKFIKQSLAAGAILWVDPFTGLFAQNKIPGNKNSDSTIFQQLVTANDAQVEKLLLTDYDKKDFSRRLAGEFAILTASYCCGTSKYFGNPSLLQTMQKIAQHLLRAQTADGTVNVGNLESPPDTAFVVEVVAAPAFVLQKDNTAAVTELRNNLKIFLVKAGDALVSGGVHTPNHRWVISAALAKINAIYPSPKYVQRIDEWLAEGIFINSDGNYAERSRIYSMVENTAFLTMGRLLNRPSLFEPVKKNLETTWYYTEPNGDLVTNDSRRQDQYTAIRPDANVSSNIVNYYLLYRYMAIERKNGFFAAITKMIEGLPGFEERMLNRALITFLEDPILQNELPPASSLPVDYEKLFAQSGLLRIRRNSAATTFFGGADLPLTIASGRSNSPDFYAYRKGDAVLQYMRLSTSFFSTGYFYSDGLKKEGNRYVLYKKTEVPYYQPLLKTLRKNDGDYLLSESIDGRFWNKMDFKNRPVSNVKTMEVSVTLTEQNGRNELLFDIKGFPGVLVSIEICFKEGGKLSGVTAMDNGNHFLESGTGTYEYGNDKISFGPGTVAHKNITGLEGERYSTHFGSLRTEGMHVYLTGVTPFVHQLTFS